MIWCIDFNYGLKHNFIDQFLIIYCKMFQCFHSTVKNKQVASIQAIIIWMYQYWWITLHDDIKRHGQNENRKTINIMPKKLKIIKLKCLEYE